MTVARQDTGSPLRAGKPGTQQLLNLLATGQQQLIDDRHDLHHSLEVARVAMWKADLTTGHCSWSPNARQILGLGADTPIDSLRGFFSAVAPEDVAALEGLLQDMRRDTGTVPEEWEFRIIDASGEYRWMYARGQRVPGSSTATVRGVMFDITGRRQLQQQLRDQEQVLSGIVDASPDGIVVSGLWGEIRFASMGIHDIIGMRPHELVGRYTWEFVDRDLHGTLVEATQGLLDDPSGIRQARLRLVHRDGHEVTVDCRFRLLTDVDGAAGGLVVVVRDVTEQAQLEAELARARDHAEAANRAKSEYLTRMSHELRTPMNSVLGFAQVLELSELSLTDRDSVERILGAGRHLLQLIDDVLDIARVEAGRFTISLEPVQVSGAVSAATDLLSPQVAGAGLHLSVDVAETLQVVADRRRLSQVLINLLSNAVKYTDPGGEVTIVCSQPDPSWCRLTVADTGRGIAESDQAMLFGAFERLGAEQTDVPGTGLGLALSRTLVEAMGGHIGCTSTLGAGTTFWIDLPTAPVDTPALETPPAGRLALATITRTH